MFKKKNSSGGLCNVCTVSNWIIAAVGVLLTLAALIGVYKAHFLAGGATFGTTNGSLSLIAAVACLALGKKMMKSCCPCQCAVPATTSKK